MKFTFYHLLLIFLLVLGLGCKQNQRTISEKQNNTGDKHSKVDSSEHTALQSWNEFNFRKLDLDGYRAQFTPDSKAIIYSNKNLDGLQMCEIPEQKTSELCNKKGAGNQPVIYNSEVVYQVKGKMKYLEKVNFLTSQITAIDENQLSLTPQEYVDQLRLSSKEIAVTAKLSSDINSIQITKDGKTTSIAPQGKKNYIYVKLSPSSKQLLYKVAGLGAYITDLEGFIIKELGDINSASWLDDTHILFSASENDGLQTLKSELYIRNINSNEQVHLSKDIPNVLEFPSSNQALNKIVANTPNGHIYVFQK